MSEQLLLYYVNIIIIFMVSTNSLIHIWLLFLCRNKTHYLVGEKLFSWKRKYFTAIVLQGIFLMFLLYRISNFKSIDQLAEIDWKVIVEINICLGYFLYTRNFSKSIDNYVEK